MAKIKMNISRNMTIEEGGNMYLMLCRARNYSEYTIKHYNDILHNFSLFHGLENELSSLDRKLILDYVDYLREKDLADRTILTYIRGLKTILAYLMDEGLLNRFEIDLPKVDEVLKESYTESELKKLLKKPDMKKCTFAEYRNWVLVNYLLSTGQRLNTVINVKIEDIDFDNEIIRLRKTKGRRETILPMGATIQKILQQYLQFRRGNPGDYLFCSVNGKQMTRGCITTAIQDYNRSRGVERTSIHAFRHTFGKNYLMNGGDVFRLQKLMCHKRLETTKGYLNLSTQDLKQDYDSLNPLDAIDKSDRIKMEKR